MKSSSKRFVLDKLFKYIVITLSIIALTPLFLIIASIIVNGGNTLLEAGISFLYNLPPSPLSTSIGGIGPSLIGTLLLATTTIVIGLPLAFFTAVLAVEYPDSIIGRLVGVLTRSFVEIPTILIGVLIYTLMVIPMGRFSALAGAFALAIVALPYMYTYVERALSSIPWTYREAAYGLGLDKFKALIHVFIGIARRGIVAGILIGLAKASGETAPLLFTIGGSKYTYFRGLDQPIDSIPLLIYEFAQTPYEIYHRVAWGAALVLLLIYLVLFITLRAFVKRVEL
ncbi:phosphate ABC transporter, inner membrane subunit PstA [Staphylothermus marinus F1]|uniref:Phosphate transport system permease protein PstA n=1 Tax=Staphylothermus marinus (strain ATCC 43588 / DSM 3639 / JCM 9404 / F1) TaxID=399550 RepID=A3DN14_STAMF|nr:phosphate ABC transporter permease PstA [Staphylothermus marinus]ABN70024.1 phosphate ABC transporter, inner membrane subunit PstA [Staphylothermus marinus F1]